MSIGIVSGDPTVQLAVLMLENASLADAIDREQLEAARQAEERASADRVAAMHDAADAVAAGAWVQGGLTVLGAGTSIGGVAADTKALDFAGGGASALAEPVGTLFGAVPKLHAEAEAASAADAANRAGYAAEDARSHMARVDQHAGAVVDLVTKILDAEAQGANAVLGNF